MSKSPRHKLNKTDKRLLDTLVAAGYEHDKARDLIQKQVYTLTLADQRHVVSEISNGVNPTQAYSAVYQARRIRLARKYLNGKRLWKKPGKIRPISVRISFAAPETPVFTQILSFLGISGASQLCSQLIDLKLYLQSVTEHFLSGINIRNNAVFCLLGLLLKNIAVRMTGNRSRKNTKKQDWHTFFHGIIPDSLTIKSHWE